MERYDDPVEVRTGAGDEGSGPVGPAQFLWRGRLWKVRAVLERRSQDLPPRELWRVAAGRGRLDEPVAPGVFELALDPMAGRWQLVGAGE